MANALILETTFLIDLEREIAKGNQGPSQIFLEKNAQTRFYITTTIAGELAAGTSLAERQKWENFVAPFYILPQTREVCWQYGQAYRFLRENGLLIGANDLWIAATAIAHKLAVVTRNERHYRRVPGLSLQPYLTE